MRKALPNKLTSQVQKTLQSKNGKAKRQLLPLDGKRIVRSQMVEILIPANTNNAPKTTIPFPDIKNLRNVYLHHIQVYTNEDIAKSILTGAPVISVDMLKSIFVSLQGYNGKLFQSQKPGISLRTTNTTSLIFPFAQVYEGNPAYYTKQKVSWSKSYIEIADSTLISDAEKQSVLFQIFYSAFDNVEKVARQANFKNQR